MKHRGQQTPSRAVPPSVTSMCEELDQAHVAPMPRLELANTRAQSPLACVEFATRWLV
jgi:hypothetical protein